MSKQEYTLTISRLTVDKLGVKLYDKASAVVSELIANAYDADAKKVIVSIPLATLLDDGAAGGQTHQILVVDDGHGMSPKEAQEHFLRVGKDRRFDASRAVSLTLKRPVMGRKGIGKLAPFGICRRIEVWSAGGGETSRGYQISHFIMDYEKIVRDDDEPVALTKGPDDRKFSKVSGTRIKLTDFQKKRVPNEEVFLRQLAARFILGNPDFKILVEDTRTNSAPVEVTPLSVPINESTKIDLRTRPILTADGTQLVATGWLAMGKLSYQNEEAAGVRIYARNKIVATTRDFEQPAGFTGEFTMRSYLVGEVHAEWLDLDNGEDLIRSDRQGILWDSDYGRELRDWGANLIKEIAKRSAGPRRESAKEEFFKNSDFTTKARARYPQKAIQDAAIELAEKFGSFAAKDELHDQLYLDGLTEIILSVAPHKALIEAFQQFALQVDAGSAEITDVVELFTTARVAELASYGQIADQRVRSIKELQKIVLGADTETDEEDLQRLIAQAPWLIHPTWTVLSDNKSLKTFAVAFQKFYKDRTGDSVSIDIGAGLKTKRPDFTAVDIGRMLHIVEIKSTGHPFNDFDWERLSNYVVFFKDFFDAHKEFKDHFQHGHQILLVADSINLTKSTSKVGFNGMLDSNVIKHISWTDFLLRAQKAHEQLLNVSEKADSMIIK